MSIIVLFVVVSVNSMSMDGIRASVSERAYQVVDHIAGEEHGDQIRIVGSQHGLPGDPSWFRWIRGSVRTTVHAATGLFNQYQEQQEEQQDRSELMRLNQEGQQARENYRKVSERLKEKHQLRTSDAGGSSGQSGVPSAQRRLITTPAKKQQIKKEAKRAMLWSFVGFIGGCISTIWGASNLVSGNSQHFKRDLALTTVGIGTTGFSSYTFMKNVKKYRSQD